MSRRLPPFSAIKAFEAAARLHSFRAASEELCVTQSAISHQIKALEQYLNAGLFYRTAHGLELTSMGSDYFAELTRILDRLEQMTRKARDTDQCGPLALRATPLFASRWLLPRLQRFNAAYPEIELEITTTDCPLQFPVAGVDILIQYGSHAAQGLKVEPFLTSARYPVCSPEFRRRNPALSKPEGLAQATLLRDVVGDDWQSWFKFAGINSPDKLAGPRFAHCELTLRAAEESQGVALAYGALVEDQLARGTLVRLFDLTTPPTTVYSLTCLEASANLPRIAAFRNWAFAEVKDTSRMQHLVQAPPQPRSKHAARASSRKAHVSMGH